MTMTMTMTMTMMVKITVMTAVTTAMMTMTMRTTVMKVDPLRSFWSLNTTITTRRNILRRDDVSP